MEAKDIATFFALKEKRKVKTVEDAIAGNVGAIAEYTTAIPQERIASAIRIKNYENSIRIYTERKAVEEKKLEKLKSGLVKAEKEAKAQAVITFERLKKHKGVQEVVIKGHLVEVITPLVWVNIREAAGSKKTVRTCIGAYLFTLDFARLTVKVKNLVFDRHWAISNDVPCLGEYADEVTRLMRAQMLYETYDLLFQWLVGADRDASAYMPSHNWRDSYRSSVAQNPTLTIGQWVVMTSRRSNPQLYGYVGMITSQDGVSWRVTLKAPPGNSRDWWVLASDVVVISQKKFKDADRYRITETSSLLKSLDAMKSGTLEDFTALQATPNRIKITAYEA